MSRCAVSLVFFLAVCIPPLLLDEPRAQGDLYCHHDGSFEDAYSWHYQGGGIEPPYYGAYGESFTLGPGEVHAIDFWLTWSGYYCTPGVDLYVWDSGISDQPGEVLAVEFGVSPGGSELWPEFTEHRREIHARVEGDFTIGIWNLDECGAFGLGADVDGPGGHPWTCIAPGLEWPSGWQHPSIVFGPTQSLAIGAWFTSDTTTPASPTWGSVKSLFR